MSSGLLRLEDCLEDSPQTRALIGVFEQDANGLLEYAQDINAACRKVSQAQNELAVATQALTLKLKDFQIAGHVGCSENENLEETLQQLASSIDEISSYNTVLYSELSENMEYQSQRFLEKDLSDYLRLKSSFHSGDKAHEEACSKLARVSRKSKSEKSWQEATDHLYAARKSFHNTSMSYCCCLNDLQSKKKSVLLKPILSYLRSQIIYFRMGADLGKPELEEVLHKLTDDLSRVEKASEENRELLAERIERLDAESARAYIPDPPASMNFPDLPVDTAKTQISGYLFYRSRSSLLTQWHRSYFFTQGGNLMQQNKKEVAGQLFMDLDGCTVAPIDIDERRNVFQIVSANGKHTCILQGQSKQQCEEWISTVRNISSGHYLQDNPREAIDRARQASLSEVSTPNEEPEQKPERSASKGDVSKPAPPDKQSRSDSFEKKNESNNRSVFARLRQAANSLIAPDEKPIVTEPVNESPKEAVVAPAPVQPETVSKASADNSLDGVLDPSDPVLFDLPSPISQPPPSQPPKDEDESKEDPAPPRHNPFSSSEANGDNEESSFKAMFVVRFLGCKRIPSDSDLNVMIADSIWQVMAARALHKVFRMNELHLVVSDKSLRLVDPATQLSRETFPVSSVLNTKTHSDNPRLLGFVVQRSNELHCYTFESNADGDDVCCAINTALVMEQSKVEHEETRKQREIEIDLAAQSRMITESQASEETNPPIKSVPDDDQHQTEVAS